MLFLVLHSLFLLTALGYGWIAGTKLDRIVVGAVVIALALTLAANTILGFAQSGSAVLLIDCALLAVVTLVALKSKRQWPVWFAGFQFAAVLFGIAATAFPTTQSAVYHTLAGFFAIPALLSMALGLFRDRQEEKRLPSRTA